MYTKKSICEDSERFYTKENQKYYSVTTIIGKTIDKPALRQWMVNLAVDYLTDVLQRIQSGEYKIINEYFIEEWIKNAKLDHKRVSNDSKERGTLIHKEI